MVFIAVLFWAIFISRYIVHCVVISVLLLYVCYSVLLHSYRVLHCVITDSLLLSRVIIYFAHAIFENAKNDYCICIIYSM